MLANGRKTYNHGFILSCHVQPLVRFVYWHYGGEKIKFGNKVAEIVHASGECMELVELACFVNLLLCWIDHTHKQ